MWKWANDKKTMQFFFVNGEGVSNYLALSFLAVNLALSHALPVESALFRARISAQTIYPAPPNEFRGSRSRSRGFSLV
jgi:hypothetical protein